MILTTAFCLTACKSRTDEMADQEIYTEKQMTGQGRSQEAFLEGCTKTYRGFRWET